MSNTSLLRSLRNGPLSRASSWLLGSDRQPLALIAAMPLRRESDDVVLESDADEQLLIYIPFRETVKISSISIKSPSDGSGPATVKVFKNVPAGAMDFDDAENSTPTQELEWSEEELEGAAVNVKLVSFQDTSSLTLFVENNVGDVDETVIQRLIINGQKVQGTNMNDLKAC